METSRSDKDAQVAAPRTPISTPEMFKFLLENATTRGPRLGRLSVRNFLAIDVPIHTPNYVATTSRGIIPHLSHDVLRKHTNMRAVYCGLEDFIEKARLRGNSGHIEEAAIFRTPLPLREHGGQREAPTATYGSTAQTNGFNHDSTMPTSILRAYTALPDSVLSILGPRRVPRIECPAQNTNISIAICTSVGFADLKLEEYNHALRKLRPDMSMSMADLVFKTDAEKVSRKRIEKMADRTHAWLRDTITSLGKDEQAIQEQDGTKNIPPVFASVPPLEKDQQRFYLSDLGEEFSDKIQGVCLYSPETAIDLPESIQTLPRICLDDSTTPHAILRAVSLGIDLITLPFITAASEAGMAFDFTFPAPPADHQTFTPTDPKPDLLPLALNLWSSNNATSLEPLTPACPCYTCTRHHRAYIHHLLSAKEMLAWTLLQIHNFHTIDMFFQGIRESLSQGQDKFEEDIKTFSRVYEAELPNATGEGPRVRGYQMKSAGGGEPKKNRKVWGRLDEQVEKVRESVEIVGLGGTEADGKGVVEEAVGNENVVRDEKGRIQVESGAVNDMNKSSEEIGAEAIDSEAMEQHGLGKKLD